MGMGLVMQTVPIFSGTGYKSRILCCLPLRALRGFTMTLRVGLLNKAEGDFKDGMIGAGGNFNLSDCCYF